MRFSKKKFLFVLIWMTSVCGTYGQVEVDDTVKTASDTSYWVKEFSGGLNFNQAAFSSNWKSGGVNSVALGTILAGKANYANVMISFTITSLLLPFRSPAGMSFFLP